MSTYRDDKGWLPAGRRASSLAALWIHLIVNDVFKLSIFTEGRQAVCSKACKSPAHPRGRGALDKAGTGLGVDGDGIPDPEDHPQGVRELLCECRDLGVEPEDFPLGVLTLDVFAVQSDHVRDVLFDALDPVVDLCLDVLQRCDGHVTDPHGGKRCPDVVQAFAGHLFGLFLHNIPSIGGWVYLLYHKLL